MMEVRNKKVNLKYYIFIFISAFIFDSLNILEKGSKNSILDLSFYAESGIQTSIKRFTI